MIKPAECAPLTLNGHALPCLLLLPCRLCSLCPTRCSPAGPATISPPIAVLAASPSTAAAVTPCCECARRAVHAVLHVLCTLCCAVPTLTSTPCVCPPTWHAALCLQVRWCGSHDDIWLALCGSLARPHGAAGGDAPGGELGAAGADVSPPGGTAGAQQVQLIAVLGYIVSGCCMDAWIECMRRAQQTRG